MPRPGPVDRVRARLLAARGPAVARLLPTHYQRLGRVALVRWPEPLRPAFPELAHDLAAELGVATVARIAGPAEGEERTPRLEVLYGTSTETQVLEDGVRFQFDAARILYSRGNRAERARIARAVGSGEVVMDLFAGIGYFALPIARHAGPSAVWAVERNPVSHGYLVANVRANRLLGSVRPLLGDCRSVELPERSADRVLLGILPDATPFLPRALDLLRSEGGTVHLHRIAGAREPRGAVDDELAARVQEDGRSVVAAEVRRVKNYGPGREHRVHDLTVGPRRGRSST